MLSILNRVFNTASRTEARQDRLQRLTRKEWEDRFVPKRHQNRPEEMTRFVLGRDGW